MNDNNMYNNSSDNNLYNNTYDNSYNPIPNPKDDKPKKKKKGFFLRFIGLTMSALLFGIIAGAAASGYHYLFRYEKDKNEVIIDEENKTSEDEDIIELSDEGSARATKIDGIITDVSDVVTKVMPSIVSISSTNIVTQYDIFFGRQFSQPVKGSGSGIIIGQSDSSILIVTNNHVVTDTKEIEVEFIDGKKSDATIKGSDSRSDLAILEVAIDDLSENTLNAIKVARLGDSKSLKAGEMVIAIGNALGYGQSVTVGYISALNREITNQGITMKLIQTDAAINPGNSGGALININGEVIGINSMKFADTKVEGMGYAIPIADAIPMINLLMNNKASQAEEMGFLGINVQTAKNVTSDLAAQFNMPIGVFVKDIVEGSPAEQAGLKSGNIIVGLNDVKVETTEDILNILSYSRPGEEVTLKIKELQNGEYIDKELKVVLSERPD